MGFSYGRKKYNGYRKRTFTMSDSQSRAYASEMEKLEQAFNNLDDWILSSMKDSCYKNFGQYEVRISNHSANNKYHDLENGKLIVNIKASKLDFIKIINENLDEILSKINELDLEKYRFINVTSIDGNINCFYKGYKTKKDVF